MGRRSENALKVTKGEKAAAIRPDQPDELVGPLLF
jgi:hypothetical protein